MVIIVLVYWKANKRFIHLSNYWVKESKARNFKRLRTLFPYWPLLLLTPNLIPMAAERVSLNDGVPRRGQVSLDPAAASGGGARDGHGGSLQPDLRPPLGLAEASVRLRRLASAPLWAGWARCCCCLMSFLLFNFSSCVSIMKYQICDNLKFTIFLLSTALELA